MNKQLKNIFNNSWIELAARCILGGTFVYASYHKIVAPEDFAKILYGYGLFPGTLINLIAIVLPFLELVSGLALILGIYPRSAAVIINGMLLAYIIVLSINLIRGHEFDCGCFSAHNSGHPHSTESMIVRDIIYFLLGLLVFLYAGFRRGCIGNHIRNVRNVLNLDMRRNI